MKLPSMTNLSHLMVRALMLIALSVSPLMADYSNPAVSADSQDPAYWVDQGGLFATYGNHFRAVEAFKKALDLDENNSHAHYDIALALTELGRLSQALAEINSAIALDAESGLYYYGRAWILLKSGRRPEALDDFQKAADKGNPDAIAYLRGMGKN